MNYFVDEQELEIVEKNLFTATEIVTLLPLQGEMAFEHFFAANAWTRTYLPNNILRVSSAKPLGAGILKRLTETALNTLAGEKLDNFLLKLTSKRWNQKTNHGRLNAKGVLMSMAASRGSAKPNPVIFQERLLASYSDKVSKLLQAIEAEY